MRFSFLFFFAIVVLHCNNYGLVDKLENPSTEIFSDRLFVFVTSAMTQGDMQGLPSDGCSGTGISRADCVCQVLAIKNGRRRSSASKFVAWLSDTTQEMRCRIVGSQALGCAPTGNHTWYNTNSEPVFNTLTTTTSGLLATSALSFSARYTEAGVQIPSEGDNVWTGTDAGGILLANHCFNWTSNTATPYFGRVGNAVVFTPAWTNASDPGCDQFKRLYCFAVP